MARKAEPNATKLGHNYGMRFDSKFVIGPQIWKPFVLEWRWNNIQYKGKKNCTKLEQSDAEFEERRNKMAQNFVIGPLIRNL